MRLTLQNRYHVLYYMKEVREILMTMEIQFMRISNYAENDQIKDFSSEMKSLLKEIEKPKDGEVSLHLLKAVSEKIRIRVRNNIFLY